MSKALALGGCSIVEYFSQLNEIIVLEQMVQSQPIVVERESLGESVFEPLSRPAHLWRASNVIVRFTVRNS